MNVNNLKLRLSHRKLKTRNKKKMELNNNNKLQNILRKFQENWSRNKLCIWFWKKNVDNIQGRTLMST
jgi:hypothetical protein